jgi:hypothetical protein
VDWLFELDGEGLDKLTLRPLASACNCTIRPGPDARPWLGGTKFDGMTTPEQALEDVKKTLVRLNGLARLENPQHRTVSLGNAYCQDQRLHYIASLRSSSSVRLAAISTRPHRAVLRGRAETVASRQASSLRLLWRTFRPATHRWWGDKFCKRTCKNAYLRENHHPLSGWVIPRFFTFAGGACLAAAVAVAMLTLPIASANAAPGEERPVSSACPSRPVSPNWVAK